MATSNTIELSHEEALELLPWLVNASLTPALAQQVATHVERCAACREESATLSNTMLALNVGEDLSYARADLRFQELMQRIRTHEAERASTARTAETAHASGPKDQPSFAVRVRRWLGAIAPRPQLASAAAIGLLAGALGVYGALQLVPRVSEPGEYRVYAEERVPLQLTVEFRVVPDGEVLRRISAASGVGTKWLRQSDRRFAVQFTDGVSVEVAAALRARLLAEPTVVAVEIGAGQ